MNKKSYGEKVNTGNHFTLLYNYIPQIDKYIYSQFDILWYMTLGLFKLFNVLCLFNFY